MTPTLDAFFAAHQRRLSLVIDDVTPIRGVIRCTRFICSRSTFRDLMRENYGSGIMVASPVKMEPDRVFGLPVAYDDSLADGVVLPAYTEER